MVSLISGFILKVLSIKRSLNFLSCVIHSYWYFQLLQLIIITKKIAINSQNKAKETLN